MTSDSPACPYCNTPLPPLPAVPPTAVTAGPGPTAYSSAPQSAARLPCPACGEPVPVERWPVGGATPPAEAAPAADLPARKRRTALVVGGVMAGMFVLGLSFALYTMDKRADRHPKPKEVAPAVVLRSPRELDALAYLPPDAQVAAGLHLRELLQDEAGRRLFAAPRPAGLDALLRTTGLTPEQVDHVAAAVELAGRFARATVVVRTVLPYDQRAVAQAVQPARASLQEKRPLFRFAGPYASDGYLWCVDERTLIVALVLDAPAGDPLHGIPAEPRAARDLPPRLNEIVAQRLSGQSRLWLVGDLEKAAALAPLLDFVPKDWQAVRQVKALAVGVYPQDGLTLLGQFYTGDPKAARAAGEWLEARRPAAATSYKVEAPPAGAAAAEQWVTLQVRGDVDAMRELLNRAGEVRK